MGRSDLRLNGDDITLESDTVAIRPVDTSETSVIELDSAERRIGLHGRSAERITVDGRSNSLEFVGDHGEQRLRLDGRNATITFVRADSPRSRPSIRLSGDLGLGTFGGSGAAGQIHLSSTRGDTRLTIEARDSTVRAFAQNSDEPTVELNGRRGRLVAGAGSPDSPIPGRIDVRKTASETTVSIDGDRPSQTFYREGTPVTRIDGSLGKLTVGNGDVSGRLELRSETRSSGDHARLVLDGHAAELRLEIQPSGGDADRTVALTDAGELVLGGDRSGASRAGSVTLTDGNGTASVRLTHGVGYQAGSESADVYADGGRGQLVLGGATQTGSFEIRDHHGTPNTRLQYGFLILGSLGQSSGNHPGMLQVMDQGGVPTGMFSGYNGTLRVGGGSASIPGQAGTLEFHDVDGTVAGSVSAEDGGLTFRGATGSPALRIDPDGLVKTSKPIERL